MAKVECSICGCVHDEYWMMRFYNGRTTQWLCWDCYLNSQREAQLSDLHRQKRLYRIHENKKRNK